MDDELKIEDYMNDLKSLCDTCRKSNKCKNHDTLCLGKKLLWNLGKKVYKQRKKQGLIQYGCS